MPTLSGDGVRVVLVGTGTHVKGSLLPDVAAVKGTVDALQDCLLDVCGVLEGNLVTLLDPPGPEPFLDEVLRAAASASDVLLTYYVGHGVLSTAGDLHLATHKTVDLTSKAGFQALAYSELVAALVNCRARLVVVILDCCYSGRATNPVRSGAVLASADYDEQALAPVGEAYPAFSGQLLRALRDGVPSAPPQLTLQHLHDHLSRTMQRENRPRPVLQMGNQAGELVLATNRAYQPPGDEDVAAPWDGACPYRGLEPFTAKDEQLFHGRADLVNHVLKRLGECVRNGGMTVVDGPSGSGKTSLLFAGIVPAIGHGDLGIAGSSSWPHLSLTPGEDPLGNLAAGLSQLGPDADPKSIRAELAAGPEQARSAVRRATTHAMGPGADVAGARLVLVVDQLEELFAPAVSDSARSEFVMALDAVAAVATRTENADPPAVVIVGLRADFSGQCARFPELAAALENNHIVVGPMTTAELRSAIVKPAEQAGLALQPGLVELVLRDTGADPDNDRSADYDPGALPLLSHALLRTWQHRRGNLLTVAGYRDIGGVTGAISTTAEHTYTALEPASQEAARRLLLQMVRVGDGVPDTRRRVNLSDLPPAASVALEAFANSRLVTMDRDTAEITHEALIRSWPRLRDWMNEDRAGRLIAQEVETAAAAWQDGDRDTALLHRGSRLATARTLAEAPHHGDLSTTALDFLTASTQQERRTTRLRRSAVAVLVVLLLIASGAAVFAYRQRNIALAQRDTAISSRLLTAADALGQTDQSLAAQLDVLAFHLHPSSDLRTRLLATQDTPLSKPLPGLTGPFNSVALSPDDRTLATGSYDGAVRLWNITDPAHSTQLGQLLTVYTGDVTSVAFSPDGHTLATVSITASVTVQLWNVTDPAHPTLVGQPLTGDTNFVNSVAFSSDGYTLTTASGNGTIRLWNVTDSAHTTPLGQPLTAHTDALEVVAFSLDGHTLASSGSGTVRLWDLPQIAQTSQTYWVTSVAFSPDGRTLATGSIDSTIRLWNVTDPAHPTPLGQPLTAHTNTNSVRPVAFSPDSHTLATASDDGTVQLWNVTDPAHPTLVGQPLTGHTGGVVSVTFSPDSHTLATASDGDGDGTVWLWDVTDPARAALVSQPLTRHTGFVASVAFSPDGRTLAVASSDGTVRLWGMDVDSIINRICATAGNDLTPAQWQLYAPELPPTPLCGP